jgi:hypothetical protein
MSQTTHVSSNPRTPSSFSRLTEKKRNTCITDASNERRFTVCSNYPNRSPPPERPSGTNKSANVLNTMSESPNKIYIRQNRSRRRRRCPNADPTPNVTNGERTLEMNTQHVYNRVQIDPSRTCDEARVPRGSSEPSCRRVRVC